MTRIALKTLVVFHSIAAMFNALACFSAWRRILFAIGIIFPWLVFAEEKFAEEKEADTPLILAVHPYKSYETLMKKYSPLAEYLSKTLARQINVRIGRDYSDHLIYVGSNKVDIAVMGPASYVKMVATYGEKPLLARFEIKGKSLLNGVIIVRRESPVNSLASLKGKRFAFGDRESTMSHLVPRFMLKEAGIDIEDLGDYKFLGSHDNVALAVLAGAYDAGAVKADVFEQFRDRGLKAIISTPSVSEHVLVARSNLPMPVIDQIRSALYSLKDSAPGREIMRAITKTMSGMVPASDADYDNLRTILRSLDDQDAG